MQKLDIECKNCGCVCGSFDPGRVDGPVEKCYPPEYIKESPIIDEHSREFCSMECFEEYYVTRGLSVPREV